MDCGDRTVSDTEFFVDDFDNWGEAVGGAGRRGDKPVCIRIAKVLVSTIDKVKRAAVFYGCRDIDFFISAAK